MNRLWVGLRRSRRGTNRRCGLLVDGFLLLFAQDIRKRCAATLAHACQFLCSWIDRHIISVAALGTFYLHGVMVFFYYNLNDGRPIESRRSQPIGTAMPRLKVNIGG